MERATEAGLGNKRFGRSKNDLLLFLDLDFGQAPIMGEVSFFLPYFEQYAFVHMAIDPEWMFPRRNGIPGINLSNVRASELNPIIEAIAAIPIQYHVPRKMLIIHQYRPDGDGLKDPYDPGQAEIADKRNLLFDPRVDHEARVRLMMPKEVLSLNPPPMVVTYGN